MLLHLGLGLQTIRGTADGGTPEWVPEGDIAYADFVEGNYYADGGEVAVESVVDLAGASITANGLEVESDTTDPSWVAAFLQLLSDGISTELGVCLVMDIFLPGLASTGYLLGMTDLEWNWETDIHLDVNGGVNNRVRLSDYDALEALHATNLLIGSLNRVAVTLNRSLGGGSYQYAVSVNGIAAVTDTIAYLAPAIAKASIGGIGVGPSGSTFHLRKCRFRGPATPAELATLSALS